MALEAHRNKLFELYTDKSKHFQRVFTIVVGISAFFFLMILFPYFSLKYEYSTISQFNPLINGMYQVTDTLNEIINDTQTLQNNVKTFHDTGVRWYQDLTNSSRQLGVMQYLQEQHNQTLSNSTLQQNLFEKFTGEYGIGDCDSRSFGTSEWQRCNYDFIIEGFENRTKTVVAGIRQQLLILLQKIDIQTHQLNSTVNNIDIQTKRLDYLQRFDINPLTLRSFFINAKDNIQKMGTNILDIYGSLEDFSFIKFEEYPIRKGPNEQEVGLILEETINKLQTAKQPIEQSNTNLVNQKTKIDSVAQKIADRLEQPNSPLGTLPVGFNELVLVFPIALAGGFFVCISSFLDAMNIRRELQHFYRHSADYSTDDQQISSTSPLWLDPLKPEQNKIIRFTVLVIPFLIFVTSCLLIVYSWITPNMSIGGEHINRYVFGGLYLLSGGLFLYGYLKIVKEYRHYRSEIIK
jgi:hypothetical protein